VRNVTSIPLNSWTVRWTLPSGQSISQLWNGSLTVTGSLAVVRNVSWNGSIPVNGSTTFGFLATSTGTNTEPSDLVCVGS